MIKTVKLKYSKDASEEQRALERQLAQLVVKSGSGAFDEDGALPVAMIRDTLKTKYKCVIMPTIEELYVLSVHVAEASKPTADEHNMYKRWMESLEEKMDVLCDFCEQKATNSMDYFTLRRFREGDFGVDTAATPAPRYTLHVLSHAACSNVACRQMSFDKTIDMAQRIEVVGGCRPQVSSKASCCLFCSKNASSFTAMRKCSRCMLACYCSHKCQKADWKTHKKICCREHSIQSKA